MSHLTMIITTAGIKTAPLTAETAAQLKDCERVTTFTESGWFFAYGWVGDNATVLTHANSKEEYDALMNAQPYGMGQPSLTRHQRELLAGVSDRLVVISVPTK